MVRADHETALHSIDDAECRIPLLDLQQDATYCFDFYHSANDILDKVDREDLKQVVAAYAVAALVAAEMEDGLEQPPPFRERLPFPFADIMQGKEPPR